MNRDELTEYIYDFWVAFGVPEYNGTYDMLYDEIYNNLGSLKGIKDELDTIKYELECGWDEDSLEYKNLIDLKNKILDYKKDMKGIVVE